MAKKIDAYYDSQNKCIVINSENVQKGDYIEIANLSSINDYVETEIKTKYKSQIINEFKNRDEYKNLVDELNDLKIQQSEAKQKHIADFKQSHEFMELKNTRDNYFNQILELKTELSVLKRTQEEIANKTINEFKASPAYRSPFERIAKLETELETSYHKHITRFKNTEEYLSLQNQKNELEKQLENKIRELNYKSTKSLGEELENWAEKQFENTIASITDDVILEKTNLSINGNKPDFLLSVYATNVTNVENKEDYLCGKVVFEMKTESDLTQNKNKQRNKDHLDKLAKDQKNYEAEIACLVTELEKEDNFMIKRAQGYDNIYIIRPQMFIPFISLFRFIALKNKEIKLANIQFKQKEEILAIFNEFKDNLLENTIKNINSNCVKIQEAADKIQKHASDIIKSTSLIIDTHLNTFKNKFEQFNIEKKVINKIEH